MIDLPPVIGHRGAAGLAPENTLASFRRAAALGVAMVEFDARLTADRQPVVFHDDTLERTTDGAGAVAARSLAELKRLDAGSWFAPQFGGERIATLDEVLILCLTLGLGINLEIKPDRGREAETARVVLACAAGRWPASAPVPLVSSFIGDCLAVAREQAPAWPRGLLVEGVPEGWRDRAAEYGCTAIHADHRRLDREAVAEVRNSGLSVLAYTVNDAARALELRGMGVCSVFSDYPQSS
ncbi:MAG: glycerophosphodiester phosphodiesterase [Magnetospirillum sp.]|nr:MAG: glycerophosphodiester phosphodiesterase [Magnetospirillum sp.]